MKSFLPHYPPPLSPSHLLTPPPHSRSHSSPFLATERPKARLGSTVLGDGKAGTASGLYAGRRKAYWDLFSSPFEAENVIWIRRNADWYFKQSYYLPCTATSMAVEIAACFSRLGFFYLFKKIFLKKSLF